MIKITATVLSYNNVHTIKECIESLKKFDEILVLDSNSTDGTREYLEKQKNVTLYSGPEIKGNWIGVHNALILESSNPYVFYLDSDEIINVDFYDELKMLWTKHPDAFPVHARATVIRDSLCKKERFPDPQFRGGPKDKFRYYNPRNTVHEILDPKYAGRNPEFSRMKYIIVHNHSIDYEWSRNNIRRTQDIIRKTPGAMSLYDEYKVQTWKELLDYFRKMPAFPLSDVEKQGFILPRKERLEKVYKI